MPEYKIVDAGKLDADLKAFADAIRAKLGTQASLRFPDGMATAISQISSSASSANVAWGAVIPTQDYYGDVDEPLTIIHNLGITPNFYIIIHNGEAFSTSNRVEGSIVIDVGNIYLQGEWLYSKSYGTSLAYYNGANYDDVRNALFFVPYVNPTADRYIVAGEEYIWICGVLGEPFGELITFTINGTTYQANEGMNWSDWVYSNYNTAGFALYDAGDGYLEVHSASGASVVYGDRPYYTQYASDEITAGTAYRTV